MADRDGPEGVRGILLAFIVLYGVLWPILVIIADLNLAFGRAGQLGVDQPGWRVFLVDTLILSAFQIALPAFASYRLAFRHNPLSVRIVICVLWLLAPLTACISIFMKVAQFGVWLSQAIGESLPMVVGALVHAGLWTLYFLRSRRVANTYHAKRDTILDRTFA